MLLYLEVTIMAAQDFSAYVSASQESSAGVNLGSYLHMQGPKDVHVSLYWSK